MTRTHRIIALAALAAAACGGSVNADEGMWTFDNLPLAHLKERYGFEPTKAWIEHLRSSAVRFNSGGSGSFVSADGLVMTNHHVGADTLQKISTKDKDFIKTGFLAKTREEEVKAPDLELNVLVAIEDVTDKVNAAVPEGTDDAKASTLRRGVMAKIEKESLDKSGLRSDVVTLYQGGRYSLYTYKKYTDVRLVFAPEFEAAFFGGDPDNFEYPRYDLDVCFFRAYEDGKPASPQHYLKWSPAGSKEGDLTFVAGHPGRTSRLFTVDHLNYLREKSLPLGLELLTTREKFLLDYAKLGPEQARQSQEDLFGIQNSRKARLGGYKALKDAGVMARKAEAETALRGRVDADPAKKAAYAAAWSKIADAQKVADSIRVRYSAYEGAVGLNSTLFGFARELVRLADEKAKPNADRLREYRDSAIESLELELFSSAPIYPDYEEAKLVDSLAFWAKLHPGDPLLAKLLDGRTAAEAAKGLVHGSKLADVATRKRLAEGGTAAIRASDDPMIRAAILLDPAAREVRKIREDQVDGVQTAQYALIARAIFADRGTAIYPDATFTLRLSFGRIAGIFEDGRSIAPYTTMGGAFEHAAKHGDTPPYQLPPSWTKARAEHTFKLDTPLNFINTADIIGGNSGSPVVNRDNEVVGLIFDGNIESLMLDYAYDDKLPRAVSVDSRGIIEALRGIYGAGDLAREITGK